MFDSLKYAKILEEAGVPREQAETHVYLIKDVIGEEMATKKDLDTSISSLKLEMSAEFTSVRSEMNSKFEKVHHDMVSLEHRMVIKLGTITAALMTLALTANHLMA